MKRFLIGCMIICSWATITLSGCGGKTFDLSNLVIIKSSGLDTKGKANVSVDWSLLEAEIKKNAKNEMVAVQQALELENSILFELDKEEDLSNGDKITLTISWNKDVAKEAGFKFKGDSQTLTVSDLREAKDIDLFADLKLDYDGVSPDAELIIRNESSDSFVKSVNFSADSSSNISNGDVITIKAQYDTSKAESAGYLVSKTEKQYTVSGIDEYIQKYEDIDDETMKAMEKQAIDLIEATFADEYIISSLLYPDDFNKRFNVNFDDIKLNQLTLTDNYFFVLKAGMTVEWGDVNNSIFMVYKAEYSDNYGSDNVIYMPVYFKNIIKREDEKIDVVITDAVISDYNNSNFDNMYRDVVTSNKAKYEYEEISLDQR